MKNQIADCRFMLDYVRITIVSSKPSLLVKQLAENMRKGKTVKERKTKPPIMPDAFETRTYFEYDNIKKMYLFHDKKDRWQNIDALLEIHDVPYLEMLEIEQILYSISSVNEFHFCRIELRWDFNPAENNNASVLQSALVKHMHLANSRSAFYEASPSRTTYYVNKRESDIQEKVYIQPKVPSPHEIEFVRLELTVNTRWLDKIGLTKPSDFLMLNFDDLTKQLTWLDMDYAQVQKSDLNVLTGGRWGQIVENEYEYLGAARVINDNRINNCTPQCSKKGDLQECLLTRAHNRGDIGTEAAQTIEDCPHAKKQSKFEAQYFKPSKHTDDLNKIMRDAFDLWCGPTAPSSSNIQIASNTNRRKKKA